MCVYICIYIYIYVYSYSYSYRHRYRYSYIHVYIRLVDTIACRGLGWWIPSLVEALQREVDVRLRVSVDSVFSGADSYAGIDRFGPAVRAGDHLLSLVLLPSLGLSDATIYEP